MNINATHQNALIAEVRRLSREIRALLKGGNIATAQITAASRSQYLSMARASGCSANRLTSALRA